MKIIEITEGAQFTGYYKDEKKNVWTYPDTMDTTSRLWGRREYKGLDGGPVTHRLKLQEPV